MQVRGAAAIAVTAARSLASHLQTAPATHGTLLPEARRAAKQLDAARPTAISLHNALGWVLCAVAGQSSPATQRTAAQEAAALIGDEIAASHKAIATHGAAHLERAHVVLTHCNSATALAILKRVHAQGHALEVIATETRPFRQGVLTVQSLHHSGVQVALVVDSAVEHILATRDVDAVLVGADTVAADGSLFNKIGTAGVATLAHLHGIPVYCAAGLHKFTRRRPDQVPIEERGRDELVGASEIAPEIRVFNPVFDRTDPERISAYITETGLRSPHQAVESNWSKIPPEDVWG